MEKDIGEASWGRKKLLAIDQDDEEGVWCDHCESRVKHHPVISMDSSGGEYGCVSVCLICVQKCIDEFRG